MASRVETTFSPEELAQAADHVLAEVESVASLHQCLKRMYLDRTFVDPEWTGTVGNALVEALLLHTRCLIEFLIGRPRREGTRFRSDLDINPRWFAPSWSDPQGAHPLDEWLKFIDSHAAHLSLDRAIGSQATGRSKPFIHIDEMVESLVAELRRFTAAASSCPEIGPGLATWTDYLDRHAGPLI